MKNLRKTCPTYPYIPVPHDIQPSKYRPKANGLRPPVSDVARLECFHGGWGDLSKGISLEHYGTGEGKAMGRGFYTAQTHEGGEYFAAYVKTKRPQTFIHQFELSVSKARLWRASQLPPYIPSDNALRLLNMLGFRVDSSLAEKSYHDIRYELNQGLLYRFHRDYRRPCAEQYNPDRLTFLLTQLLGIQAIVDSEGTKPAHGLTYLVLDPGCLRVVRSWEFMGYGCYRAIDRTG